MIASRIGIGRIASSTYSMDEILKNIIKSL
jgi:hypothetical protein